MKKKLLAIILLSLIILTGCGNYQAFDTVQTYHYAIIELQNGQIIEGNVQTWKDYEGEQLQVRINDKTYLVHSENITLIHNHNSEPWDANLPTMPVLENNKG